MATLRGVVYAIKRARERQSRANGRKPVSPPATGDCVCLIDGRCGRLRSMHGLLVKVRGMEVKMHPAKGTLKVRIKRAYEPPAASDGTRILIDRLWPRGVTKSGAAIAQWMKEIAPSNELRKWFGHDPERWEEFRRRYQLELKGKRELLGELRALAKKDTLTLVYSAHDETHNQAVVLQQTLLH